MGSQGRGPLGAQRDPMGGDPWEREPLGAQGTWTPHGRGTLGSPRDPMGGDPWGPPLGAHLKVFCDEVTFKNDGNHENRAF